MQEIYCPLHLTGVAAAVAGALDVEPPHEAAAALEPIAALCKGGVDRVLMYNPDAVALWLFEKYTDLFLPVMRRTQLTLPLQTVMPSVTPVCFGTMYTGAEPAVHGIQSYTKPVIRTDTVFDALIRAGKKPCIISTGNDSMSRIFLERDMDYCIVDTPDEANAKALALIEQDRHDLIAVYNGNYDGAMHKFGPESPQALAALRHNVDAFSTLADAVRAQWTAHRTLSAFAPDHGCHEIDGDCGSHGLYMPEDMNIIHFYGIV